MDSHCAAHGGEPGGLRDDYPSDLRLDYNKKPTPFGVGFVYGKRVGDDTGLEPVTFRMSSGLLNGNRSDFGICAESLLAVNFCIGSDLELIFTATIQIVLGVGCAAIGNGLND